MTQYVLLKRDLYENPGHMGYTGIRDKAGTWPAEDFAGHGIPIKEEYTPKDRDSYAIPIAVAPEFTNECFHDLSLAHLRVKVEQLSEENAKLRDRLDIGPQGEDAVDVLESAIGHLRFRIETLELALRPFAKAGEIKLCGEWRDDERFAQTDVGFHLNFGHLRRASEMLKEAA